VGTHYDSVPGCPGANDNGTGVASLIELSRLLDRRDLPRAMFSLETMGCFSNEEGSQHYPFPLQFFYPSRGNFIGFVGNLSSRRLVRRALASFRRHASIPAEGAAVPGWITGIGWSDHWGFWQQGYPAVMVTDTAFFPLRALPDASGHARPRPLRAPGPGRRGTGEGDRRARK
jgi:hypothetical protein